MGDGPGGADAARRLRALGDDENGTAHRIGLAAGAVLVPVVLAAALWWVASRIVRRPRPPARATAPSTRGRGTR